MNPTELYVSPEGSDLASGTIETPLATISTARDRVRTLKNTGSISDVSVYLRGGTYTISETVVFGLDDSAPDGSTITYCSYRDEEVVLSSGVNLSGWERADTDSPDLADLPAAAQGKIWAADMPRGSERFYTLYVGEHRRC
jgi:hypothetical protein